RDGRNGRETRRLIDLPSCETPHLPSAVCGLCGLVCRLACWNDSADTDRMALCQQRHLVLFASHGGRELTDRQPPISFTSKGAHARRREILAGRVGQVRRSEPTDSNFTLAGCCSLRDIARSLASRTGSAAAVA